MVAEHLKPLTSLRFVAAIWVVMFHYWPALSPDHTPALVQKGYLGVELFFVLSGFILCHVYLQAAGEKRLNYGGFLWARLARIYPLHLVTLAGMGLLAFGAGAAGLPVDPNILSWEALPANLLMVHAWGFAPVAGWNHPSWSISAEWFAYLTFPAFAWAAWRLRARPALACALAAVLIGGLYAAFETLAGFPLTQATIAWGALRIVPCFAFGCALYLAYRSGAVRSVGGSAVLAGVSALLIVGGAAALLPDAVLVAACGGLILGLAGLSGRAGVLSAGPMVLLGEASYSLYMICVPWKVVAVNAAQRLTGVGDAGLPLGVWLAVVATLPLLSIAAYLVVEKPARAWMRALADRRAGEGAVARLA